MPSGGAPGLGYGVKATDFTTLYPATAECWLCGDVQEVADRSVGLRRCAKGHEEVTWMAVMTASGPRPMTLPERPAYRSWHQTLRD